MEPKNIRAMSKRFAAYANDFLSTSFSLEYRNTVKKITLISVFCNISLLPVEKN
jgi:hypothetical protein